MYNINLSITYVTHHFSSVMHVKYVNVKKNANQNAIAKYAAILVRYNSFKKKSTK